MEVTGLMPLVPRSRHWIARRDLFGSDAIIVATIVIHLSKATAFLMGHNADWPISMHAIRIVFHHNNLAAALTMILACTLAIFGEWANGGINRYVRLLVLFPLQFGLLFASFLGAAVAVWLGVFPCSTFSCDTPLPMPRMGLYVDQIHRLLWPWLYGAAVYARIRR